MSRAGRGVRVSRREWRTEVSHFESLEKLRDIRRRGEARRCAARRGKNHSAPCLSTPLTYADPIFPPSSQELCANSGGPYGERRPNSHDEGSSAALCASIGPGRRDGLLTARRWTSILIVSRSGNRRSRLVLGWAPLVPPANTGGFRLPTLPILPPAFPYLLCEVYKHFWWRAGDQDNTATGGKIAR